jgi:ABC-type sulfate/molybdate transport systems ATPase subunit
VNDLTVIDLHVERGGRSVLDGCNVRFPSARRSVLWGRSGAGKSTLLHAIAGLIRPTRGQITLGSEVFLSVPDRRDVAPHRRRIGYVFQDLALWPHLTALQQVSLVCRSTGSNQQDALALLERVGLGHLVRRRPGELSGGEQQRLAIARALAGKPAVLLLDEPFGSVDRETRQSLYGLIRAVSAQIPGPTIYVTHSTEDAENLAECAFRLDRKTVVAVDRPWEDPGD